MKKVIAFISKQADSSKDFTPRKENMNSDTALNDIEQKIDNELQKLVTMDLEQKINRNEDIKKMISYYLEMTNEMDSRRNRFIEASWQTLTILIAASGLLFVLDLPKLATISILLIFGVQIVSSLIKIFEYQAQSGYDYPFKYTKYSNQWKWFYYGNPFITKLNFNPCEQENSKQNNLQYYLEGLDFFVEKYRTETIDLELVSNIQQLFLLQVHNAYKNRFFLRLNKFDIWANKISLIIALSAAIVYLGCYLVKLFL